jgi:meiotic recombination protein SPO11
MRRLFLKKMKTDLRIPVLGLVDSDPYGLKVRRQRVNGALPCS